jgi:hypothetical protein
MREECPRDEINFYADEEEGEHPGNEINFYDDNDDDDDEEEEE